MTKTEQLEKEMEEISLNIMKDYITENDLWKLVDYAEIDADRDVNIVILKDWLMKDLQIAYLTKDETELVAVYRDGFEIKLTPFCDRFKA